MVISHATLAIDGSSASRVTQVDRGGRRPTSTAAAEATRTHTRLFADRVDGPVGGVAGRSIALLGLTFKAGTDGQLVSGHRARERAPRQRSLRARVRSRRRAAGRPGRRWWSPVVRAEPRSPRDEAEVQPLIRSSIARGAIRLVALVSRDRLVPLALVRTIRRIGSGENPLAPKSRRTDASAVGSAALRALLDGVELGYWALGPQTIDELVRLIEEARPGAIIEYGSGASTVVLGWAVREVWGPSVSPRIVSLEQSEEYAERTRSLLTKAGLQDEAVVVVAPLAEQDIEGLSTTCYALPDGLSDAIGGRAADLVVIDGPVGPSGVRFGTLPLARPYLSDGATFVLDDALRDGELEIAQVWAGLSYARIDGIRLIEKGILVGAVTTV